MNGLILLKLFYFVIMEIKTKIVFLNQLSDNLLKNYYILIHYLFFKIYEYYNL